MNWKNLYEDRAGEWLKGNLHTHTSPASGCAIIPPLDCVNRYVELGYDFVSISDHMTYTNLSDDRITFIPGIEWNSAIGEHTGIYTMDPSVLERAIQSTEQDPVLEYLAGTDALVVLNHPNWLLTPHYRREALEAKRNFLGLEIYNGVVEGALGYAIATDKWDYLLIQNKKILGFANDDSHSYPGIGLAFNMVRAKSNSREDIFNALKSGNFYASSGATINDIRRTGDIIEVETADGEEIRAIVDGGIMIERSFDSSIKVDVSKRDNLYIRFEVYGRGSAMAWTQPFFLKQ